MMKDNIRPIDSGKASPGPADQGTGADYTFRCADMGYQCSFETHGGSEEEVMNTVAQHGRESHNMQQLSDQTRYKIRNNIRHAA
jgi:predicted small metal-binding protein